MVFYFLLMNFFTHTLKLISCLVVLINVNLLCATHVVEHNIVTRGTYPPNKCKAAKHMVEFDIVTRVTYPCS